MPTLGQNPDFESLVKLIKNFKRSVICPSEMWIPLFTTLPPESARGFLESLPDDLKLLIRQEYFGLAWYRFQAPEPTADLEVAKIIAQWCEQQGNPGASPES
jgi:hypothetical protein